MVHRHWQVNLTVGRWETVKWILNQNLIYGTHTHKQNKTKQNPSLKLVSVALHRCILQVFWDVSPCRLVDVYRLTFQINLLCPPSTMVMAECLSVHTYQTTQCHTTEHRYIQSHWHENFAFQNTENCSPVISNWWSMCWHQSNF